MEVRWSNHRIAETVTSVGSVFSSVDSKKSVSEVQDVRPLSMAGLQKYNRTEP